MSKRMLVSEYIGEREEEFIKDLGEVILKYYKNGKGKVCIDDLNISKENGWRKITFWYKFSK